MSNWIAKDVYSVRNEQVAESQHCRARVNKWERVRINVCELNWTEQWLWRSMSIPLCERSSSTSTARLPIPAGMRETSLSASASRRRCTRRKNACSAQRGFEIRYGTILVFEQYYSIYYGYEHWMQWTLTHPMRDGPRVRVSGIIEA